MQITFLIISILALLLFYIGTGRNKRLLMLFTIWQLLVGTVAALNVFKDKPGIFPLVLFGTFGLIFVILKRIDKQKIRSTILLSIQVLRIPVELLLFQLFLQNKIPDLITFKGWNFDILIGISALAMLIYQFISKRKINRLFFIIWNFIGIGFLLFVVSLAILSSPLPIQQFAFNQPNIAVLEFPYCYLPACVVPLVFMSHILLIYGQKKQYNSAGFGRGSNARLQKTYQSPASEHKKRPFEHF